MSEVGQLCSLSTEGSDAEVVGGAGGDGLGWWHIRVEEGDARLTETIYIGHGEFALSFAIASSPWQP
jgi:hypothetical protein